MKRDTKEKLKSIKEKTLEINKEINKELIKEKKIKEIKEPKIELNFEDEIKEIYSKYNIILEKQIDYLNLLYKRYTELKFQYDIHNSSFTNGQNENNHIQKGNQLLIEATMLLQEIKTIISFPSLVK